MNESNETPPPRSLGQRLLRSCLRIFSVLLMLFLAGCFLVAQPSMRSNEPSSKNPMNRGCANTLMP